MFNSLRFISKLKAVQKEKRRSVFFTLILFSILILVIDEGYSNETQRQFLSNRSVEIEWDEVPGAIQYDLEIYDGKYKKFIKTFSSKTNIFKLNVKMGKYYFRSRIFDKFSRSSEWTEMAELVIAPPPTKIKNQFDKPQLHFASKSSGFLDLPLSWEPLPGITDYKVVLESPDGKIEVESLVKGSSTVVRVPPGQHQIRIRAILADGTIGDLSEPTPLLSVMGAKIQKPFVSYRKDSKLGPIAQVKSELSTAHFDGELYYMPLEGKSWSKVKDYKNLKANQIDFNSEFKPGKYLLKMQAKSDGYTSSDYGVTEFVIKPLEVVINPIPEEIKQLSKSQDERSDLK